MYTRFTSKVAIFRVTQLFRLLQPCILHSLTFTINTFWIFALLVKRTKDYLYICASFSCYRLYSEILLIPSLFCLYIILCVWIVPGSLLKCTGAMMLIILILFQETNDFLPIYIVYLHTRYRVLKQENCEPLFIWKPLSFIIWTLVSIWIYSVVLAWQIIFTCVHHEIFSLG